MVVVGSWDCCDYPNNAAEIMVRNGFSVVDDHTLHTSLPNAVINNGSERERYNFVCILERIQQ